MADQPVAAIAESSAIPVSSSRTPPKPFSWGQAVRAADTNAPTNKASLAAIMAEETETRQAAQVVYQADDMTFAQMEAEQARLLQEISRQPLFEDVEVTHEVVDRRNCHHEEPRRHASTATQSAGTSLSLEGNANVNAMLDEARNHLSDEEIQEIERALREEEIRTSQTPSSARLSGDAVSPGPSGFLSPDEVAAIEAALRAADAQDEQESLQLALTLQQEELATLQINSKDHKYRIRPVDDEADLDETAGFRMNSMSAQEWARRRDGNTILGPNNEIRTKHDVQVQGQANAQYLGLDEDDFGLRAHVGNQAFNSFKKNLKRTTKGVATHGTGRAGTDSDAVKGKAMDPHVRLHISKAINTGLIERCNGEVKQGKEAVVYHAEQGAESHGYDVAVKVFKRITEFKGRGAYVDGDPRYFGQSFRKNSDREQVEIWAEKEFRNLVRANRALVPVPTPLQYKENIIFMRFMGNNGWPAPQIREIEMRKGSQKWDILYTQCMEAIRRLYVGARLVHGDLSEYNILVAPTFQVENSISSSEDKEMDLQVVFIDFGQAVEIRHPESKTLLERDIDRVQTFFTKQGVKTRSIHDSLHFVVDELHALANEGEGTDETTSSPEKTQP